jgi:hypothetical protein
MLPQQAVFTGIWQAFVALGRIPSTAIAGLAASNHFHGRPHFIAHVYIDAQYHKHCCVKFYAC